MLPLLSKLSFLYSLRTYWDFSTRSYMSTDLNWIFCLVHTFDIKKTSEDIDLLLYLLLYDTGQTYDDSHFLKCKKNIPVCISFMMENYLHWIAWFLPLDSTQIKWRDRSQAIQCRSFWPWNKEKAGIFSCNFKETYATFFIGVNSF